MAENGHFARKSGTPLVQDTYETGTRHVIATYEPGTPASPSYEYGLLNWWSMGSAAGSVAERAGCQALPLHRAARN